jgi:hypothetical protein
LRGEQLGSPTAKKLAHHRAGYYLIDLNSKQAMQRLVEPKKPWEPN